MNHTEVLTEYIGERSNAGSNNRSYNTTVH